MARVRKRTNIADERGFRPPFEEPFEPPFDADVVVDTLLAAGNGSRAHRAFPRTGFPATIFGVQFGGRFDDSVLREVGADTWFDRPCVTRFMVRDQVVRYLTELPAGSDDLSAP
jgi:hypothetical protein